MEKKLIPWEEILVIQDRQFNEKEQQELTESIKNLKLINEINICSLDELKDANAIADGMKYRVVAGKRRAVSLQELFPEGLHPEHYNFCEDNADMIAYAENSIRKNFTLREEIAQIKKLTTENRTMPISELAAKLGRSVGTIRRRIAIANLPDEWLAKLDDPDIRLDRMEELAALPEDERKHVYDYDLKKDKKLDQFNLSIAEPWDDDCKNCEHNTACGRLFAEEALCLSKTCYFKKYKAAIEKEIVAANTGNRHLVIALKGFPWNFLKLKVGREFSFYNDFALHDYQKGSVKCDIMVCIAGKAPEIISAKVKQNFIADYSVYHPADIEADLNAQKNKLEDKLEKLSLKREKVIFECTIDLFKAKSKHEDTAAFAEFLNSDGKLRERLLAKAWKFFTTGYSHLPIRSDTIISLDTITPEDIKRIFDRDIFGVRDNYEMSKIIQSYGIDYQKYIDKVLKLLPPDDDSKEVKAQIKEIEKQLKALKPKRAMKKKA